MSRILVLYYSRNGSVAALAREISRAIEGVNGESRVRTVPPVSALASDVQDEVPESGPPWVERADLEWCDGLAMGSPTRFGNMAAPLKHFLDQTGAEWASGTLVDKPAAVFTSTSTLHGGQESTLLSMMIPLLHHGMTILGAPLYRSGSAHKPQAVGHPMEPPIMPAWTVRIR